MDNIVLHLVFGPFVHRRQIHVGHNFLFEHLSHLNLLKSQCLANDLFDAIGCLSITRLLAMWWIKDKRGTLVPHISNITRNPYLTSISTCPHPLPTPSHVATSP